MSEMPDVVLIERAAWTSERNHVRERFEIWGGDVTEEWAKSLRVPSAPWCAVTIWDEGDEIVGWGGEVWPGAYPALFHIEGQPGRQRTTLTDVGREVFARAREQAVR